MLVVCMCVCVAAAPSAPTNVTCHGKDSVTAIVSWQAPRCNGSLLDGASIEYQDASPGADDKWFPGNAVFVKRCNSVTGKPVFDEPDGPITEVWSVNQLKPGHTYRFRVAMCNGVGYGPFSSPSATCRTEGSTRMAL